MMKRSAILAFAVGLLFAVLPAPFETAAAYTVRVCAPIRPGVQGQTSFVGSSTSTTYRTDSRGCVLVDSADLGSALSAG